MKKLTLTILVAMVPFLMMAQKNKRKNNSKSESQKEIKVIKAVQPLSAAFSMQDNDKSKLLTFEKEITFSPPMVINTDGSRMTIEEALEVALNSGYEVYSSNTVLIADMLIYFYFMKR